LRGVITGEGPTTEGRVHFSRTIDAEDAALCAQVLIAASRQGEPVSREEADMLFEIDAAAAERLDQGRFDDLFAKAIMHHVRSASGLPVPPRSRALALTSPLDQWAFCHRAAISQEVRTWLETRLHGANPHGYAARTLTNVIAGLVSEPCLAGIFNVAA
jgi:hypothetical protein